MAPQPVENSLKLHALIGTAVVVGDGRKFASVRRRGQPWPPPLRDAEKIILVPDEFLSDDDTLTPTLKLRRKAIEERYRRQNDALYDDARSGASLG